MRKMQTIVVDDLDGVTPGETVELVINGEKFSIDLSKKHRADLRKALKRYTEAATHAQKPTATKLSPNPEIRKNELAAIRQWAKAHNIAIPSRGRIPGSVMESYNQYVSHRTAVG